MMDQLEYAGHVCRKWRPYCRSDGVVHVPTITFGIDTKVSITTVLRGSQPINRSSQLSLIWAMRVGLWQPRSIAVNKRLLNWQTLAVCFEGDSVTILTVFHSSDYDMPSPDFGAVYDDVLEEDPACDTEVLETINQAKSDTPLLLKCRLFTNKKFSIYSLYLLITPCFQVHTERT